MERGVGEKVGKCHVRHEDEPGSTSIVNCDQQ